MKDLETLRKLAKNPYYKMSEADKQALKDAENQQPSAEVQRKGPSPEQKREMESQEQEAPKEKASVKRSSKGNAAAKETGKLDKHSTDPVTE